jgi:mono/diheme cytochrome c family protein
MRSIEHAIRARRIATGLVAAGLVACLAGTGFTAPNPANGKPLFTKYCLACHFPDGKAKMKGAPDLSSKAAQEKITDQKMTDVILNGTPHMPGYKKQMSAAQAADLTAYVRTLGK